MIRIQTLIEIEKSRRLKEVALQWLAKGTTYFIINSETQMTIITWKRTRPMMMGLYEVISCCTYIPHINMVKHSRWIPSLDSLFRKKNLDGKTIYFCDEEGLKSVLSDLGVLSDWLIYRLTPVPKKEKK